MSMSVHYGGRGPGHIARVQGGRTDWIFTSGGLDPRITFTRASSGTYFDSSGVMQTASTDVPRFNYLYNGSAWVAAGLLVEPAATNLLIGSRDFSNASWTKLDATITANAANGVDGTATMDLVTEGSAASAQLRQTVTIVANATYTLSHDFKRGNHDWVRLIIMDAGATSNFVQGYFNLATGALGTVGNSGTATGAAATIQDLGNGIYRCTVSGAVNNSATSVFARTQSAVADNASTRVNNGERYQDRAQLESGSVATSFIETTAATATRADDFALISGTNFSSWYNQSEGTFVVEYDVAGYVANQTAFSANDGTTSERIAWYSSTGSHRMLVTDGGVSQATPVGLNSPPAAGTTYKSALAYKTDDFAISTNGGAAATDTSGTLPTVNRLYIGSSHLNISQLNGHIRSLMYWPTRLSDSQLQSLSSL